MGYNDKALIGSAFAAFVLRKHNIRLSASNLEYHFDELAGIQHLRASHSNCLIAMLLIQHIDAEPSRIAHMNILTALITGAWIIKSVFLDNLLDVSAKSVPILRAWAV